MVSGLKQQGIRLMGFLHNHSVFHQGQIWKIILIDSVRKKAARNGTRFGMNIYD